MFANKHVECTNLRAATAFAKEDLKNALHHFEEINGTHNKSATAISLYKIAATNCHWKLISKF